MINKELAEELGVSEKDQAKIQYYQGARSVLELESSEEPDERQKYIYELWMATNRRLQSLWGFDLDDDKIKFWEFPACSCPTMDNNDAYPYGHYIYNVYCPIHGYEVNSKDLTPEDINSVKGILSDEEAEEFYHRKIAGE